MSSFVNKTKIKAYLKNEKKNSNDTGKAYLKDFDN
jgi:hypothetical protein